MMKKADIFLILVFWAFAAPPVLSDSGYGLQWNDEKIKWHDYETGIEQARLTDKPLLVVLFAPWCAVCHQYEAVFQDERVMALVDDWVVARIDVSDRENLSQKFTEDGIYTPRIYIIGPDGNRQDIHSDHPEFKHFFAPDPDIFVSLLEKGSRLAE